MSVERKVLWISPRLPVLCGGQWYHFLRQDIVGEDGKTVSKAVYPIVVFVGSY